MSRRAYLAVGSVLVLVAAAIVLFLVGQLAATAYWGWRPVNEDAAFGLGFSLLLVSAPIGGLGVGLIAEGLDA